MLKGNSLPLLQVTSRGETSLPTIVLKMRHSLRAVHFHPHAAPCLLTAEVNDLDSSVSSIAHATSPNCLHPPPAAYLANVHPRNCLSLASELPLMSLPPLYFPSFAKDDSRTDLLVSNRHVDSSRTQVESSASMLFQIDANAMEPYDHIVSHMEMSPAIPSNALAKTKDILTNYFPGGMQSSVGDMTMVLQRPLKCNS